jgi:hypothetical protein
MKTHVSGVAIWRLPEVDRPPGGAKMLLLTPGGVCVIGTWDDWCVAWSPLPSLTLEVKQRLRERNGGH